MDHGDANDLTNTSSGHHSSDGASDSSDGASGPRELSRPAAAFAWLRTRWGAR